MYFNVFKLYIVLIHKTFELINVKNFILFSIFPLKLNWNFIFRIKFQQITKLIILSVSRTQSVKHDINVY